VLPMSAPAEEEGTFTNVFGLVQTLSRAIEGRPSATALLRTLADRLGTREPAPGRCAGIPDAQAAPFAADVLEERFEKRLEDTKVS